MRVVIVGASGNIGTSLLDALATEAGIESVIGVSRRRPRDPQVEWVEADIVTDELTPIFKDADAVVHLAWAIQPSHNPALLRATNVGGTARVFAAAGAARVGALIFGSSVGVYSRGPKDRAVDESWPRGGISTSFYSTHKAEAEKLLDVFEREHPDVRVVRMRPGLVFKREAASSIRRLFVGPVLPMRLLQRRFVHVVPHNPQLRVQAVHSRDVGEAYRLAVAGDVAGAFNIAADPVLDGRELARLFDARTVPAARKALKALAGASWRLHVQPTPPGWVDLAYGAPVMDCGRARTELGWGPKWNSVEALVELLNGMRAGAGAPTPPLAPDGAHTGFSGGEKQTNQRQAA